VTPGRLQLLGRRSAVNLTGDWNVGHRRGVQVDGPLAFGASGRTLHGATVALGAVDRADWMVSSPLIQHTSAITQPKKEGGKLLEEKNVESPTFP
jgi:hypothetical protein